MTQDGIQQSGVLPYLDHFGIRTIITRTSKLVFNKNSHGEFVELSESVEMLSCGGARDTATFNDPNEFDFC